ncbi:MAG: RNA polymerase sigma factor [Phycisphaerales bacterium]
MSRAKHHLPAVDYSLLEPEALAVRAQQGDRDAFGELVIRFEPRLFNFLLQRVRIPDDAAELTQDALTRAWERINDYAPSWRFSTWVFTIASRMAVSHHRKHGRMKTAEDFDMSEAPRAAEVDDASIALGSRLWRLAAEELTPEQHTILWLRYAEDLSISEIAGVVSKTAVGVRVALFRARQALAAHLASAGTGPEGAPGPAAQDSLPPIAGRVAGGLSC